MVKSIFILMLILGCCLSSISAQENSTEVTSRKEDDSSASATSNDADADDSSRTKRQHDKSSITNILNSIFKKKFSLLGSLSGVSSSSSTSGKNVDRAPPPPPPPPPKPFDWGSLKRSIKTSILQAVKAITGGAIALNGQLVKIKGHIITAKGQLIASKGDSISNFGKNLATNAFGPVARTEVPTETPTETSPPLATASTGLGESAPAAVQSSFEHAGFPIHYLNKGVDYPGFYTPSAYAKRAAPAYHDKEDTISKKQF